MKIFLTTCFIFLMAGNFLIAQTAPSIFSGNIDDLSDEQISQYVQQARAQGYTLDQLKSIALSKGISTSQIAAMERRVNDLGLNKEGMAGTEIDESLNLSQAQPAGFTGNEPKPTDKGTDPLFGYDFFSNPNITFTPNLNLATPANYELGPGDALVISIYGAAENTYNVEVNKEGSVQIPNIGFISLSGLTIEAATSKIESGLKRIYSGIGAPAGSPYKINVSVALGKVRTVQVNIIGEVKVPGTYALSSLSSVLNALYASGGPTKQGSFRDIKLVRNGEEVSHFDVYKYLIEGSQEGNKSLQDQDVIIIPPYISRVTVSGSVKRPGVYELKPDEDLQDILNYVSGFRSNAYKDRIVLERIQGDRRVVKELVTADAKNEFLQDGDVLHVTEIIDKFENRIQIDGAVYRPGAYEFTEGTTVKDLIQKAAGIKEDAFLDRGLIYSTVDGVSRTLKPFSVSKVLSGEENFVLKPNDAVRIFSKYALDVEHTLSIDGAVNSPVVIPYVENMTVKDLVIVAGGFKESANPNIIDIYRRVKDDQFETLSKTFRVSVDGALTLEDGSPFVLLPDDKVSVRYLKGFTEQIRVSITGEANYPGNYTIENKNERISDLVRQAGGLSPYAFVEGASLIRQNPYFNDEPLQLTYNELNQNDSINDVSLNNKREFRVGINLGDILKDEGGKSNNNLVLQNGDRLVIPSIKETVKVDGEVLVSALVRYEKNLTLKDYINKSGGFAETARKGKSYVVYSNGDIAGTKHFLFFRSFPKIEPGAVILVPTKPNNPNRVSTQDVVGISTGIAALALLIDRLAK